ncbi:MAG: hypothetical protein ACAI44_13080, partial [Candidatus Sericytochromatia bacterium]
MSLASPKPGEARPSAPTPTPRPPLVFDYPEVKAYPATFGTGEASIHTYDIFTQNQTPRAVSFKPLGGGKSLMFSTNYGGSEFFLVSTEPNFKVQGPVKLPYESSYILADERGNGQFLFWSTFVTGVVVFGMPP